MYLNKPEISLNFYTEKKFPVKETYFGYILILKEGVTRLGKMSLIFTALCKLYMKISAYTYKMKEDSPVSE